MLQRVAVGSKILADYTHIVGRDLVDEIRELAAGLQGARVVHLSATAFGGGVSEILYTLVPLMRDVGLECEWQVIYGREEFFNATKLMHNALQGAPEDLSENDWETWRRYNEMNARELTDGWDVCLVHDPQPAAVFQLVPEKAHGWLWRCHIDVSTPNPATIERLLPYIRDYPQSVFHVPAYVPAGMGGKVNIVPPAIDPLAPKNMALSPEDASYVCQQFGIDVDRPLITQVSRFDPWKDPLGVIDAYRIVKKSLPEVQLALVGSMASDDPEGWDFFNATIAHAGGDPDIHILNNFNNVGAIEVNAFQSHSDVLVQKSTREGFGLTVTEAIWKGRPFIGGNVGGIPLQIEDGVSGYLVDTVETCAARATDILKDPALGKALGRRGKEHVRKHFLMPRYLRDYLRVFTELRG
ncbi:MAG: glycosyltransferase [Actinomycetota bacterium]|nr:glycosyltransferase [Actinomycetota bacterium]